MRWWSRIGSWILPVVVIVEVVLVLSGVIDLRKGVVLALIVEGSLAIFLVLEVWLVWSAIRRARAAGGDTGAAVDRALSSVMPKPLARFVKHDAMMLRALWLAVRGRRDLRPGETPMRYGKPLRAVLLVLLVVDGGMVLLLHFVLPWPTVRTVMLLLGLAGVVWIVAFLCTFSVYPHAVSPQRLRLRFAAMSDVSIPLDRIGSVRLHSTGWETSRNVDVVDGTLVLPIFNSTHVTAELTEPLEIELRRQPVRVERVAFAPDDPAAARDAVAAAQLAADTG